jgi:hypothetical protein
LPLSGSDEEFEGGRAGDDGRQQGHEVSNGLDCHCFYMCKSEEAHDIGLHSIHGTGKESEGKAVISDSIVV